MHRRIAVILPLVITGAVGAQAPFTYIDTGQKLGAAYSSFVALGDLDGDGDLDAWVANYLGPNAVWLNDGDAGFGDSGQALGQRNSFAVALGDLDADGDLDAWVANYDQPNSIWFNDGAGRFTDSGQTLGAARSNGVAARRRIASRVAARAVLAPRRKKRVALRL